MTPMAVTMLVLVAFVAVVLGCGVIARRIAAKRGVRRLSHGFARARMVRLSGSGIQGRPTSIYTDLVNR